MEAGGCRGRQSAQLPSTRGRRVHVSLRPTCTRELLRTKNNPATVNITFATACPLFFGAMRGARSCMQMPSELASACGRAGPQGRAHAATLQIYGATSPAKGPPGPTSPAKEPPSHSRDPPSPTRDPHCTASLACICKNTKYLSAPLWQYGTQRPRSIRRHLKRIRMNDRIPSVSNGGRDWAPLDDHQCNKAKIPAPVIVS